MAKNFNPGKIDIIKHAVIWTIITAYLCILDPIEGSPKIQILGTSLIMLGYILVFYLVSLFIFPRFWHPNFLQLILLTLFIILSFGMFVAIDYVNFYHLLPYLGGKNFYSKVSVTRMIYRESLSFTLAAAPAIAYFFSNLGIERTRIQNEREKSLLIKELNFLKNQFNSHITFNFLNYCYSKIHQTSKETAEAVELFSNMLRYSLEIRPEEKVLVVKEIDYIKNFIQLQRLLTTKVFVDFTCEGELQNKLILSRILITFVENAFKHGQLNSPSYPITISLSGIGSSIKLKVSNKKNTKKYMINTGIGHENVMQILQLYYPNGFVLNIRDDSENYMCELTLELPA